MTNGNQKNMASTDKRKIVSKYSTYQEQTIFVINNNSAQFFL